jgi:hypothetical protein
MFGFSPSTFNDPLDVNKIAGTNSREQAKLKSQAFLTDSQLGGAATGIFAQNKAEDIMAKANASAQATGRNAAGISGLFNAAGSIGSFGAAGGFGNFGATEGINPTTVVDSFGGQASGQAGNDFFVDASGAIRPNPT